jgi:hypothetical protein
MTSRFESFVKLEISQSNEKAQREYLAVSEALRQLEKQIDTNQTRFVRIAALGSELELAEIDRDIALLTLQDAQQKKLISLRAAKARLSAEVTTSAQQVSIMNMLDECS